ncbi:MAG TPA: flagellar hook-associated protein FlgK [Solirubrobacteraceae bacterium]|nr:flagellar hook-associated protein FlgK [Solirubrobacteraceae bacterium]
MSIPTMQGLQTAISGLMAYQDSLDITGQNISNAETPGYSRQVADLVTEPTVTVPALSPEDGRGAIVGTGVGVKEIERIHNNFLEGQYRSTTATLGSSAALAESLEQVQSALNEPSSSGLAAQLSSFWSAWNSLANAPTSLGAREVVVAAGKEVATTLNRLRAQISEVYETASARYSQLTGSSGQVGSDAEAIASLNHQIQLAEQAGQQPNELLDKREMLINELAKLANTSASEGEFGVVNVSFGGAEKPLVEGSVVNWPQTLKASAGGELGALLALTEPTGRLDELGEALNKIAETLAVSVNGHQPESPFFSFSAGAAAATIKVVATPESLQAGPAGQPGSNEYASAIAALRGGEVESLYGALVARVGHEVKSAKTTLSNAEAMQGAIKAQRESVSGVSIDEEMTNMMTFQRGYEASARVLTAMDQALETLIEHTGRVGL